MAGNLDKALLQMAGFEDEGDLYAKAGSNWIGSEDFKVGKTGKEYTRARNLYNDAANWGFKNGDSRIHALLYAWAKDNPDAQITPEVIDRLNYLARTADSMNVSGRRFWENGSVSENKDARALIKQMQANPEKANEILKAKGFSRHSSPIQNYFAWAEQFMTDSPNPQRSNTVQNNWGRNLNGGDFADALNIASAGMLEDELIPAINTSTPTPEEIARSNIMKDIKNITKEKAIEERRRRAWSNAGLGSLEDEDDDSIYPDEWL